MLLTIIIFIASLMILVLIHEFGHFLMAKKFGIKVLEFGIGIPPKAWSKMVGETEVSLNWLPFGGFVRPLGEDEVDAKILANKRSFAAQNVWKRIAVVIAGVVMNLLLAWILFYITLGSTGFKTQIPLLTPYNFTGVTQQNESIVLIREIAKDSPAEASGIKSTDRVLKINGETVTSINMLITKTKELAGSEVNLTITDAQNRGPQRDVKVTPRANPPQGQGPLGVSLSDYQMANIAYNNPLLAGPIHSYNLSTYSFKLLGEFIGASFKQKSIEPVAQTVSGPVGITNVANIILTQTPNPLIPYLDFIAIISLNLAIMNFLPFPALDGGRLLFLYIEAITGKRVKPEFERQAHSIGFALLMGLIILVTFADIRRLIGL